MSCFMYTINIPFLLDTSQIFVDKTDFITYHEHLIWSLLPIQDGVII